MENLVKKSDFDELYSEVMSLVHKSISPTHLDTLKTTMSDVYNDLCDCVAEYVREQLNGWCSYSKKSAKELKSYIYRYTRISINVSDCEKIAKYIWNFCQNYTIPSHFLCDGVERRYYVGKNIYNDALNEFKKHINLDKCTTCQRQNAQHIILRYVADYMANNIYDGNKLYDLANLLMEFAGIDITVDRLQPWMCWLSTHTVEDVNITFSELMDVYY